jgi:hypothetical protein
LERVKRFERSTPTLASVKLRRLMNGEKFIAVRQSTQGNGLWTREDFAHGRTRVHSGKLRRTSKMVTAR